MKLYNLNALNAKLSLTHLHKGNSSNNKRHGKPMVTVAKIVSLENGEVLSKGVAVCSKKDNPSRQVGRELAVGRALESYIREASHG